MMESQLQELLDTIQHDGVQEAERKANDIISHAHQQADAIVADAHKQERALLESAEHAIARWRHSAEQQLQQSGENLVLAVKERVVGLFDRLLASEVDPLLSAQQIAEIICTVISDQISAAHRLHRVTLSGNEEQIAQLRQHLHQKLKKEMAQKITLTPLPRNALPRSEQKITLTFNDEQSGYQLSVDDVRRAMQALVAPQVRLLLNEIDAVEPVSGTSTT